MILKKRMKKKEREGESFLERWGEQGEEAVKKRV